MNCWVTLGVWASPNMVSLFAFLLCVGSEGCVAVEALICVWASKWRVPQYSYIVMQLYASYFLIALWLCSLRGNCILFSARSNNACWSAFMPKRMLWSTSLLFLKTRIFSYILCDGVIIIKLSSLRIGTEFPLTSVTWPLKGFILDLRDVGITASAINEVVAPESVQAFTVTLFILACKYGQFIGFSSTIALGDFINGAVSQILWESGSSSCVPESSEYLCSFAICTLVRATCLSLLRHS